MNGAPYTIHTGDCLDVLRAMEADSVDLICTDPPYFRVKPTWWDRQWDSARGFLDWLGEVLAEFARVLKPNGSLYVFCSPQMAARVEVEVSERFSVLSSVVWAKPNPFLDINPGASNAGRVGTASLRSYYPNTERIVFAEGTGGCEYGAASDALRAEVFEPLRARLAAERDRAGWTNRDVDRILGTNGMAGHYFGASQWALPTPEVYAKLQAAARGQHAASCEAARDVARFSADGKPRYRPGPAFREDYEAFREDYEALREDYEALREDYEALREDYEALRRPFDVSTRVPFTDVWTFPTVDAYPGKHECEKPRDLIRHIVRASSRPGDVVADFFLGSGVTAEVAVREGRRFVGCEIDPKWARKAEARVRDVVLGPPLFASAGVSPSGDGQTGPTPTLHLFDAPAEVPA